MWWIVAALLAAIGGAIYWRRGLPRRERRQSLPDLAPEGMFLAPSSQSQERAHRLLPNRGSEDRRDLLRAPEIPESQTKERKGYYPNSATDWTVDLAFEDGVTFSKHQVSEVLDRPWLKTVGSPMIFGKPPGGTWTYVVAKDSPTEYSELALGWRLVRDFDPNWVPPEQSEFERSLRELTDRCARFGATRLTPSLAPAEAVAKARSLSDLKRRLSHDGIVVLKAPPNQTFSGREVWDVMLSLGLEWGDMDIFHWHNSSGEGGDYWFDVWTTTPPGYFFPEEIAAGNVKVDNLVFGFSVPRTLYPDQVFESMVRAAEYAKTRLGGRLYAADGSEFNTADALTHIRYVARELTAEGFPPGAHETLYLF
jgi:cell division protein ZipA